MYDREFLDLLNERESLLDIGSGSPRVRYSKPEERKDKPDFAETIHDAKFEVVGVGKMPEGEFFWCAFCGNRAKRFVLLKRLTDNTTWKVGKGCICRVGLTLPKSVKKVVIVRDTKKYKKVEEQPKVEEDEELEETHPGMKKFLEEQRKKEEEEFVKEINELVKVEEKPKKPEKKEEQPKDEEEDEYNLDDIFED